MIAEMEKFIFVYDDEKIWISKNMVNVKDAIIHFADYVGSNSPLFIMALTGTKTDEDIIGMFHIFSQTSIHSIYTIGRKVFSDESV